MFQGPQNIQSSSIRTKILGEFYVRITIADFCASADQKKPISILLSNRIGMYILLHFIQSLYLWIFEIWSFFSFLSERNNWLKSVSTGNFLFFLKNNIPTYFKWKILFGKSSLLSRTKPEFTPKEKTEKHPVISVQTEFLIKEKKGTWFSKKGSLSVLTNFITKQFS